MTDSYVFLIRGDDWDTDAALAAGDSADMSGQMAAYEAFHQAVADLGGRIVAGEALHGLKNGSGSVTPGEGDRQVADAVHTDASYPDSSDVIGGFYQIDVDDVETVKKIAALIPNRGRIEWRKVFPTG